MDQCAVSANVYWLTKDREINEALLSYSLAALSTPRILATSPPYRADNIITCGQGK